MSIFPFIDGPTEEINGQQANVPVLREYAWDFANNEFIIKDGKPVIVEGAEAVKVWIYKALNTERFKHLAYSWNYGHELDSVIGRDKLSKRASESEIKRYVEETLIVNSHIKRIANLSSYQEDDGLNLAFTAVTDFGEVEISV